MFSAIMTNCVRKIFWETFTRNKKVAYFKWEIKQKNKLNFCVLMFEVCYTLLSALYGRDIVKSGAVKNIEQKASGWE